MPVTPPVTTKGTPEVTPRVTPCPLCGYDAPHTWCSHCALTATEPSLLRGGGQVKGVIAGLQAIPRGLALLVDTPGLKRFLVPPLFLTLLGFAFVFYQLYGALDRLAETAVSAGEAQAETQPGGGWFDSMAAWILHSDALLWLAGSAKWLLLLLSSYMVAVYAFSILYEAVAGPFLDEIHGRLESSWFGENPRDAIERPTALSPAECTTYSMIAGLPAGVALVFAWYLTGWSALGAFLLAPVPFVALGLMRPDYGHWLRWIVSTEAGTLWVSVKAAGWAALVLLLFLWLKLVPIVGPPLYFALVGFTTSITLLDIPFSRRGWSLRQRLRFLIQKAPAMTAFGCVASALFLLVPVVGLIVTVPAASVGGLWLVCRLDKGGLRPDGSATVAGPMAAAAPEPEPGSETAVPSR